FVIYVLVFDFLITLKFPIVLAIGSCIVICILFSSKLIRYLFEKFKIETYAAMIGLVSGSIYAILRNLDSAFDNQTILLSFITFFAGVFFLIILKQIQFNKYEYNY